MLKLSIVISNSSDVPIYQQLYDQLAAAIIRGDIEGGEGLPPIRSFAAEMGVSVITVKRTWEELERSGLISSVQGKGCFVSPLDECRRRLLREEMARKNIRRNLPFYKSLGLSAGELTKLIEQEFG